MSEIRISEWKLLRLTFDQIGPFNESIQMLDFIGRGEGETVPTKPANLFMLLAQNGYGKTTILESIHGLFGLIGKPPVGRFAKGIEKGRVQADFLATWTIRDRLQTVIFSVWAGSESPLAVWTESDLAAHDADQWACLGFGHGPSGISTTRSSNELGVLLHQEMQMDIGTAPTELFGESQELPSVIFFPADRRLVAPPRASSIIRPAGWGYEPAYEFLNDGTEWHNSLDNLLVWLTWLDDERLAILLDFVNRGIFEHSQKTLRRPERETLMASVLANGGAHPLAALSHGERALLQLYVRIACHMTRNTIVLIDEIDIHLHTKWLSRLMQALKLLLTERQQLSIIFTTHNRELFALHNHEVFERGLVKGGFLFDEKLL